MKALKNKAFKTSKVEGNFSFLWTDWRYYMSFTVDFSSIRTVRVHKEQFDAIDNKANVVMITCIDDGRVIPFNRADSEKDKIDRLNRNSGE